MVSQLDKIYVLQIDGTDVWVPINARQVEGKQYELLPDREFDDLDSNQLFQFFPGDIVTVEQYKFSDGSVREVAKQLVYRFSIQDRDYMEFKFYATRNELPIDTNTAEKYREIIARIKNENEAGQFFYPSILDTIEKLEIITTIDRNSNSR